ncbi:MAG: phosphate/phosphite/phosphonate ABC transporter substrate-binding protein [Pirellulales bacterium]
MTEPQSPLSFARILKVVLPVAVIGGLAYWWSQTLEATARKEMASNVLSRMFTAENAPLIAEMSFSDADKDMIADPPADAAKLIAPDELVFSYVASESEGPAEGTWKELLAALKEKVGKDVKFVHYTDVNEQLEAMKQGELHIAGLNTGLVPVAVQRDGFVPLCTFGNADGSYGYTMEILVPAGSPIKDPSQIKDHKVTFTRPDSNSGCKAPFVLLMEQYKMLPERDYQWKFSLGHEDSIKQIAAKESEVAPVASDILARMVEKGEVDPAAVVSIYKSERFPPATIGYVYNLSPELRDGIREVLIGFDWSGTGLEKEFGPETTKFVPVSYKDDWANTRRIDQVIAKAQKTGGNGT